MEGQVSFGKYTLPTFARGLQVILVDHDRTSLLRIERKLKKFSFKVSGVKLASEALSMIRENKICYKFVMADINQPDLDYGPFVHELRQREIPFIWMSDNYDKAEQALLDGARRFLIKNAISSNNLMLVWQDGIWVKSDQKESHGIEIREAGGASGSAARLDLLDIQNKQVVKKEQVNQRDKEEGLITRTNNQQEGSKHKRLIDDQQAKLQDKRTKNNFFDKSELNQHETGRRGDGNRNAKGRERTVWGPLLERKFQEVYSELGPRATAKTIYEKMKDSGITQTQVASHLQKVRSSEQKKNVDSGATSLPFTNNSSGSLARHPGNKSLPNFPPCTNQNQDLNTNFGASLDSRYKNQLPAGVASMIVPLGSAQARITSAIATIPDNFLSNFSDGIQNPKPMGELGPAAGLPNIPPYANQNQELTTNFATPGIATNSENVPTNFTHGMQNVQPRVEMAPTAGSSRHPPYSNQTQYQNQSPAGVATTELLGSGQITSGIATNSESFRTNFRDGIQNVQPRVEMASAAGSSRHHQYSNQNQDLNTVRAAPFSTRHQSQLPEGGVTGTNELVGSVQEERNSSSVENFLMKDGMQNDERMVEHAFADGSLNHNQPISDFENLGWVDIYHRHSQNQGDIEQAPVFSESTDMFRESTDM